MAKIDIQHVPYRGVSVALPDLLAGRIDLAFLVAPAALPQVREGRVRALAVSALRRSPAAPNLPTMAESGFPSFDATTWYALMAPAGTPPAIVERLRRELARSLEQPEFRRKFDEIGVEVTTRTFADFVAALPAETQQWAKVIKESGLKPNDSRAARSVGIGLALGSFGVAHVLVGKPVPTFPGHALDLLRQKLCVSRASAARPGTQGQKLVNSTGLLPWVP